MFHILYPPKITLWTLQNRDVWEQLQQGQVVRAQEDLCWPALESSNFTQGRSYGQVLAEAYDWIADCLEHKDRRPEGIRWPIWAWRCIGDDGPSRPDLRRFRQHEDGVMLELEVSSQRVLLTDFNGWHFVLNEWFNGIGTEWFDQEWEDSAGDPIRRNILVERRKASWRRCLKVNDSRSTQAVLWESSPKDITRHWFYKGYRRKSMGF